MVSAMALRLAGPLFLYALVISRAKWSSSEALQGAEPPALTSVMSFVYSNARTESERKKRSRHACTCIGLVIRFFQALGVRCPAGVTVTAFPSSIGNRALWLQQLGGLPAAEAIRILREHVLFVPSRIMQNVEREFNVAVNCLPEASGVRQLAPNELLQHLTVFAAVSSVDRPVQLRSTCPTPAAPTFRGTFYYIAAGIGSGIHDIEKVCTFASTVLLATFCLHR